MRPNRTIILALALAAGTALGLAAPTAGQAAVRPRAAATCTVCRVVIYKGGGDKTPVGPAALPAPGDIETASAPEKVKVADVTGTTTLKMDVASLEKPYGDCASGCSEWWFYHNGSVEVNSFSWDQSTGTVTGHGLIVPDGSSNWADLGKGVWTPVYFQWYWASSTGADTYYCMHLDLPTKEQPTATYDWSLIYAGSTPPANC